MAVDYSIAMLFFRSFRQFPNGVSFPNNWISSTIIRPPATMNGRHISSVLITELPLVSRSTETREIITLILDRKNFPPEAKKTKFKNFRAFKI